MRRVLLTISIAFLCAGELEVDGNLKVTGNIDSAIIDSLQQSINELQNEINFIKQFLELVPGDSGDCPDGHVADASGNLYSFVEIGEQCWLSENLRTRKYNTGEDIDYILSQHNWILTNQYESPAYTECVNDSTEVELVGLFYNWYAIDDERDVCPIGTRVPTIEEVNTMISFAGGINDANNKLKEEGNYFWNIPNGTNDYNFYARGAGYRSGSGGDCRHRNIQASFWTTTTADNNYSTAWQINLYEPITIFNDSRNTGYSIRCIKD